MELTPRTVASLGLVLVLTGVAMLSCTRGAFTASSALCIETSRNPDNGTPCTTRAPSQMP